MNRVRVPEYCHHRWTSRAYVTINKRRIYLGRDGSPESRSKYRQLISEFLATGAVDHHPKRGSTLAYTLTDLVADFLRDPENYYEKHGEPTSENEIYRLSFRHLLKTYADLPATEFGPKKLRAVMGEMITAGLTRQGINKRRARIVRLFKWAVASEILDESIWRALTSVSGLRKGRTAAPESKPVGPVSDEHVQVVLPHVSRQVSTMIQVQGLTGMRPGEVVLIRTGELDMSAGDLWNYVPERHKNEHHDIEREIAIGPRAQELLKPFLKADPMVPIFSPKEAEDERNEARREARKTPRWPSHQSHTSRPPRKLRDHYETRSYRRAIHRGCDAAGIPRWSPNQIRHAAADLFRARFGEDGAQASLGHKHRDTTRVYLSKRQDLAETIAREMG